MRTRFFFWRGISNTVTKVPLDVKHVVLLCICCGTIKQWSTALLGRKAQTITRASLKDTDVCVYWLVPLERKTRFVTERDSQHGNRNPSRLAGSPVKSILYYCAFLRVLHTTQVHFSGSRFRYWSASAHWITVTNCRLLHQASVDSLWPTYTTVVPSSIITFYCSADILE